MREWISRMTGWVSYTSTGSIDRLSVLINDWMNIRRWGNRIFLQWTISIKVKHNDVNSVVPWLLFIESPIIYSTAYYAHKISIDAVIEWWNHWRSYDAKSYVSSWLHRVSKNSWNESGYSRHWNILKPYRNEHCILWRTFLSDCVIPSFHLFTIARIHGAECL